MTKIPQRVWKDELFAAMKIYQRELDEFIFRPMSPAMLERMKVKIAAVARHYRHMDMNAVWDVPVEIISLGNGAFELSPVLDDVILEEKTKVTF